MQNNNNKSRVYLRIILIISSLLFVPCTKAQLVQNLLIGNPKAIALGNAVTADPPGIDSIHFNPAGLTRLKGRQMLLKLVVGDASIEGEFKSNERYDQWLAANNEHDPVANTKSEIKAIAAYLPGLGVTEVPVVLAPFGGASFNPVNSPFTFATSAYTPLAGGFMRDENDPGKYFTSEAAVSRITFFSPSIGYQISDTFSVGASIGFSYVGAGLTLDFRAPHPIVTTIKNITDAACRDESNGIVYDQVPVDLCSGYVDPFGSLIGLTLDVDKALSTTFNLGLLWQPQPWLAFGFVYQSQAEDRLKGTVDVSIRDNIINFTEGIAASGELLGHVVNTLELTHEKSNFTAGASLDLILPEHVSLGTSIQVFPDLKMNIDWKWTKTSTWDELYFELDRSVPLLQVLPLVGLSGATENSISFPRHYEDASNFAFGIEYQYSDSTAFRFGWEPRKTGIPKDKLDFLVPIGDFDLYSMGISYRWDRETVVDLAVAYLKSDHMIPAGSSTNGNAMDWDNVVYNPVAGLDVRSTVEATILELSYESTF